MEDTIANHRSTEHKHINKLRELTTSLNASKEDAEKARFRSQVLTVIREYVDNRLPLLTTADAVSSDNVRFTSSFEFVMLHLEILHKYQSISDEFVTWLLSKSLSAIFCGELSTTQISIVRGFIKDMVEKFLTSDQKALFANHIIAQLRGLSENKNNEINLFAKEPSLFYGKERITDSSNFTGIHGKAVVASLIELLTVSIQESLSMFNRTAIWHTTLLMFSKGNIDLRIVIARLWNILLRKDHGHWITSTLAVNKLLEMEEILSKYEAQGELVVEYCKASAKCFEILADMLPKFDSTDSFRDIHWETIIDWGTVAVKRIIDYEETRGRLEKFSRTICDVLCAVQADWDISFLIELKDNVQQLVNAMLLQFEEDNIVERLQPFMSFLLMVDEASGSEEHWLKQTYDQRVANLSPTKKRLGSLKLIRIVVAALVRSGQPTAKKLLQRLVPSEEALISEAENAVIGNDSSVLSALFALVGDLSAWSCIQPSTATALLSLPFLAGPQVDNNLSLSAKRHSSIPLLCKLGRHANRWTNEVSENRARSIPFLASIKGFAEWRRSVFGTAFNDNNMDVRQMALKHMPDFLRSIEFSSMNLVYKSALSAARSETQLDETMLWIARSLCLQSGEEITTESYFCSACAGVSNSPQQSCSRDQQVPAELYTFLRKSLSSATPGQGCASLICSMVFHLPNDMQSEMAEKSLVLMHHANKEIRDTYLIAFRQILSGFSYFELEDKIQSSILMFKASVDGKIDPDMAKFLTACVKHSNITTLRYWAFKEFYVNVLESTGTMFSNSFRCLIKDLSLIEESSCSRIFSRHIRAVCRQLYNYLMSLSRVQNDKEMGTTKYDEVNNAFELTRKLFYFEDTTALLKACIPYLIPMLQNSPERRRSWADEVMSMIRTVPCIDISKMENEVIPVAMMSEYVSSLREGQLPDVQAMERICNCSMDNLPKNPRYLFNQQLLQCIAANEKAIMKALYFLNKQGLPFNAADCLTMTFVLQNNCEYVGHFLKFRTALTMDEFYETRPRLLKSFHSIIGMLEESFLDKVATRVMSVLRAATAIGDAAVPLWVQFTRRLGAKVLGQLLPRILLDIQPLLKYPSSEELFSVIFDEQTTRDVGREDFELTALVLNGTDEGMERMRPYIRNKFALHTKGEKIINIGIRLLSEECETVGKVVLEKLFSNLDRDMDDDIISKLVPVLLQTLRRCGDSDTRLLVVNCLGRIGAVDPGRLTCSVVEPDRYTGKIIFVDDNKDFLPHLFERSWKAYTRETDSSLLEEIEYCIQEMLTRVVGSRDENEIMKRLSEACRREIEPLRNTSLAAFTEPQLTVDCPIVDHVDNFPNWLQQCFVLGAKKVRQDPIKYVFRALRWMAKTKDTLFTRYILSQLIIRLIIENDDVLELYRSEMETVLRRVVDGGTSWMQLAAHIVFSIMDTLNQYVLYRSTLKKANDQELKRTEKLLRSLVEKKTADGQLLIVAAAEKCNCFFRALKWCEQYAIYDGCDRMAYFTLEKIYTNLQNVDGVLGAYSCLPQPLSAAEQILALEASGDYHEAMAFYALNGNNEPQLVNCYLRLNQPKMALSMAKEGYERYISVEESICEILHANQVEAASHLMDWPQVEQLVKSRDPLNLGTRAPWGASCAAILCAAKRQDNTMMSRRLLTARQTLIDQLTAMTIEHSDTYTQAYNYITQLQILDEIASTTSFDRDRGEQANVIKSVTNKWQTRSDRAIQCSASLEPVLRVRRQLLRMFAGDSVNEDICQLLIQSCRLARQAGHLQIAWTYLVEAQSLDVNHKDVGMEQARFAFQKGDQQKAISLLTELLNVRFASMTSMFQKFVPFVEGQQGQSSPQEILSTKREDRASFAEVQLLRAEYMMKAGAVSSSDLYKIYMALRSLEVPSEDLFYRIALFCDSMYTMDTVNVRWDLVVTILRTYSSALKHGRNHLFHAIPRMLTLWLDFTANKHEGMNRSQAGTPGLPTSDELTAKDKKEIEKMNKEMWSIYQQLDSYYFYTAFQQLISRIVHPSEEVFEKLKLILADLIYRYPHQCLWQSIAVYRSGKWGKHPRQSRCHQVYQVARGKDTRIQNLIDQYDYISCLFIKFAEESVAPGIFNDLPTKCPQLYEFFKEGTIDQKLLMGAAERKLSGKKKVTPTIMVPLTEMMDHALPKAHKQTIESFSQVMVDTSSPEEQAMGALPEVLIHAIDRSFMVLKSLQRPKRLALRGADGRVFSIMCKPKDEMRKDARFMDVNRMMNSLMRQNPEARRRQLHVKTFTVLPLQTAGGILEWVPNLSPYRQCLQSLVDMLAPRTLTDAEWFANWDKSWSIERRVQHMQTFFYKYYPLVMAEWFRRMFPDPSSWHTARSNFAKSSAVMSMIGFVLGLGDRHGENILIDYTDGCVVHVDYNLIFNKGETLPVKEIVPFRLTRNMVDGLGPTGVEGVFRKSCEATLKVMRDSKETLLTVIQTFVHDPLLEWQDSSRAQQNRVDHRGVQQKQPKDGAADAVGLIEKRLEGHIVTPYVYRWKFNTPPMSLEGQVNKLIEIATNENHLAQMFLGWAPFI